MVHSIYLQVITKTQIGLPAMEGGVEHKRFISTFRFHDIQTTWVTHKLKTLQHCAIHDKPTFTDVKNATQRLVPVHGMLLQDVHQAIT